MQFRFQTSQSVIVKYIVKYLEQLLSTDLSNVLCLAWIAAMEEEGEGRYQLMLKVEAVNNIHDLLLLAMSFIPDRLSELKEDCQSMFVSASTTQHLEKALTNLSEWKLGERFYVDTHFLRTFFSFGKCISIFQRQFVEDTASKAVANLRKADFFQRVMFDASTPTIRSIMRFNKFVDGIGEERFSDILAMINWYIQDAGGPDVLRKAVGDAVSPWIALLPPWIRSMSIASFLDTSDVASSVREMKWDVYKELLDVIMDMLAGILDSQRLNQV